MGRALTYLLAESKQAVVPPCSIRAYPSHSMLHRSNAECAVMATPVQSTGRNGVLAVGVRVTTASIGKRVATFQGAEGKHLGLKRPLVRTVRLTQRR